MDEICGSIFCFLFCPCDYDKEKKCTRGNSCYDKFHAKTFEILLIIFFSLSDLLVFIGLIIGEGSKKYSIILYNFILLLSISLIGLFLSILLRVFRSNGSVLTSKYGLSLCFTRFIFVLIALNMIDSIVQDAFIGAFTPNEENKYEPEIIPIVFISINFLVNHLMIYFNYHLSNRIQLKLEYGERLYPNLQQEQNIPQNQIGVNQNQIGIYINQMEVKSNQAEINQDKNAVYQNQIGFNQNSMILSNNILGLNQNNVGFNPNQVVNIIAQNNNIIKNSLYNENLKNNVNKGNSNIENATNLSERINIIHPVLKSNKQQTNKKNDSKEKNNIKKALRYSKDKKNIETKAD